MGGDYNDNAEFLRSSPFFSHNPVGGTGDIGFRPVVVIPEPTAPSLMMSGGDVSWPSRSGQNYSVLTTTNLTTTPWTSADPAWIRGGTGDTLIYTNTASGDSRYFKVDAWIP